MIGKAKIHDIFNFIISKNKKYSTHITLHSECSYLSRFANSSIHQNVMETNTVITIKTTIGKRTGIAVTNNLNKKSLLNTLDQSVSIAHHEKEDPDLLKPLGRKKYTPVKTFYESTHLLSHKRRAKIVHEIIQKSAPFRSFGALTTGTTEIALGNTNHLFAYNRGTDSILRLTLKGEHGSSFGQCAHRDINKLNHENVQKTVREKVQKAQNPKKQKPGHYTVLLTPEAVSDILIFLGYLGFNSLFHLDKMSCLTGKVGKRIFSKKCTLLDDPINPKGFAFPFDFEGMPKKKITLVEKGTVRNLVYDRFTGKKLKKRSTGHFTSRESGPLPLHLILKPGRTPYSQIVKNLKRGILITSLHYVNVVEPKSLTLTGMTRNGTFFIKDGTIAYPIKNMRFNQSLMESFKNILSISKESHLVEGGNSYGSRFPQGSILPFLLIDNFNFTGITEF
jgi:PmbA protein